MKIKSIIVSIIALLEVVVASAGTPAKLVVKGGADVVSSYIWRGNYNAGASIQPNLSLGIVGVTLGGWGSIDFTGQGRKEVDLSLSYSIKGFTVGVTDYWWAGEGAHNYFHYSNRATAHRWEANLSYILPFEKFPLLISLNTMFAGDDYSDSGERCYSTYIELLYPFVVGKVVDMNVFIGATPWYSPSIVPTDNHGFAVCNIGATAQYAIKCSEKFSLPIYSRLIFNPATEDIHIVFGLSLSFGGY